MLDDDSDYIAVAYDFLAGNFLHGHSLDIYIRRATSNVKHIKALLFWSIVFNKIV